MNMKELKNIARTNTTPLSMPRSTRQINLMAATSVPAGRVVPVVAFPLLREDNLRTSTIMAKVDIMEAVEAIRNGIKIRFQCHFVPFLAFDRFDGGMDEFNRSYMKVANANGGTVTPFFNKAVLGAASGVPIHRYLGLHHSATDEVNTAYIEAYNEIINFRLRNRSETLYQAKKRLSTATSLAPAFWQHEQFKYVVPDWDDAAMEGAVDVSFTQAQIPVIGNGAMRLELNGGGSPRNIQIRADGLIGHVGPNPGTNTSAMLAQTASGIVANLAGAGIKFSLANIELAKQAMWYAEAKAQFEGLEDPHIIDLLMQGISVPEQAWKQPILLADKTEIAGLDKRYATDGANLTNAVVNGEAYCSMDIVLPRCPTGGIVMVTAEILPDQLWERMRDPLLFTTDPDKLPKAKDDDLDPQKVERMSNGEVDTSHATPDGLFGYRPLNWQWQASYTRLGGKWHRSAPSNTFNQDRAQFWTPEITNPAYNSDFMISETVNQLPFVVLNQDVGEVQVGGVAVIEGNTVFGTRLIENDNAYNEVLAQVDQTRITKGV